MPILGAVTDDRRILDQKHLDTKKQLQEAAKNIEGNSMYASHQARFSPKLNELKGKRIDVFFLWEMMMQRVLNANGVRELLSITFPITHQL